MSACSESGFLFFRRFFLYLFGFFAFFAISLVADAIESKCGFADVG